MTTPTTEAIEAAARSMAEFNHWDWADLADGYQTSWLKCAENMLTAAQPFIAAQAKGEALAPVLKLHQPFTVHPSGIGTKYCVHCWGSDGSKEWPCATARAATIESEAS